MYIQYTNKQIKHIYKNKIFPNTVDVSINPVAAMKMTWIKFNKNRQTYAHPE